MARGALIVWNRRKCLTWRMRRTRFSSIGQKLSAFREWMKSAHQLHDEEFEAHS